MLVHCCRRGGTPPMVQRVLGATQANTADHALHLRLHHQLLWLHRHRLGSARASSRGLARGGGGGGEELLLGGGLVGSWGHCVLQAAGEEEGLHQGQNLQCEGTFVCVCVCEPESCRLLVKRKASTRGMVKAFPSQRAQMELPVLIAAGGKESFPAKVSRMGWPVMLSVRGKEPVLAWVSSVD